MSNSIQVTGSVNTALGTINVSLPQETFAAPIGSIVNTALASGPNTFAIPTGTTAIIIQPPVGNTILITMKGVTGDTGIPLHKTLATGPINVDTTAASFVLTAAAAISALTKITFI